MMSLRTGTSIVATARDPHRAETILDLPLRPARWEAVVTIRPEDALALLDAMPIQRPVRQHKVNRFAALMRSGQWRVTHQGIAFDERGRVIDGQHRLWAIIEANCAIALMCTFNLPHEFFEVIDSDPTPKTEADRAILAGLLPNNRRMADVAVAALRIISLYDEGLSPTGFSTIRLTIDEQQSLLLAHPSVAPTTEMIIRLRDRSREYRIPSAPTAAFGSLFTEVSEAAAHEFLHQLVTGEALHDTSPVMRLRRSLQPGQARNYLSRQAEYMYRIVRAWNAFYENRPLTQIYGSRTPRHDGDSFPRISGYRSQAAR